MCFEVFIRILAFLESFWVLWVRILSMNFGDREYWVRRVWGLGVAEMRVRRVVYWWVRRRRYGEYLGWRPRRVKVARRVAGEEVKLV